MHISDLHRSPEDPISNEELVSALLHDRDRYMRETPSIAPPEAIVVSGDIIEGVPMGTEDFSTQIDQQYEVAEHLLEELAERFLEGDRSRLVIVPGNHDVDWNTAFSAMEPVEPSDIPRNLSRELYATDSLLRWDWSSRTLYRITHHEAYERRLEPYWRFCRRFYSGLNMPRQAHQSSDAQLYDLFGGVVGLAAFNSCHGNDCFAYHGRIEPGSVARSDLGLRDGDVHDLRVAVWHHNIQGAPYRNDYMDADIVRGMIGRGFRLGLHGHQHRAQAQAQEIRLPNLETMALISAGSLCAGPQQLPPGTHRQYNIVEIASDVGSVRTHVRAMAVANVFSRASLLEFGDASYMDLGLRPATNAVGQPIDADSARRDRLVERAEEQAKSGCPDIALQTLAGMELKPDTHERQLFFDAAEQAKDWEAIKAKIYPPTSIPELVLRFQALFELRDDTAAIETLNQYAKPLALPKEIEAELRGRIRARREMKG